MEHNNNDSRAVYKCTFCEVGFIVVLRYSDVQNHKESTILKVFWQEGPLELP